MPVTTRKLLFVAISLALSLVDRPAHACGPDLPAAMLHRDHSALCSTPTLRFSTALRSLTPSTKLRASTSTTAEAEQADLRAALLDAGLDADAIDERLTAVAAYRTQLEDRSRAGEPPLSLPELPEEFRLYLLGARAWHTERHDEARRAFTAVLALAPEQRRWRSTWAAYMLARAQVRWDRCGQTDRAYAKVRELAAAGNHDSLGLAAASYGQQAQCWYQAGDAARSLALYLEQLATGDGTARASIDEVLETSFATAEREGLDTLGPLARDSRLRELVGPWLVGDTRARPEWATLWLAAIEAAGLERAVAAGPLAWAAYQAGDMDAAARWARLGARDLGHGEPLARWVLAKLELREGDVEAAAVALARIEAELGQGPEAELALAEWRYAGWGGERASSSAAAELGVLELRRDRFVPALEAFVRAEAYLDAAYVAEQLLTVDELGAFLDRRSSADAGPGAALGVEPRLRWLYARRLARAGQWRAALPYYPQQWRAEAEAHADDLDTLRDLDLSNVARARLLWRIAQRIRSHGMPLQGTELEPDWTLHEGRFQQTSVWRERAFDSGPTGPSEAERARYYANRDEGEHSWQRFHYRWVAADYAWEAAELLPDQHPATARVLCIAGGWIGDRDPRGADRFYKAMIRRNRAVDVAQWADAARWFPNPDQCSLTGIDFAQPGVRVPIHAPPRHQLSRRELAKRAWPIVALFGLFGLVGLLLIPGRSSNAHVAARRSRNPGP